MLVWYASYGSNMDEQRFFCYINGGIPEGGSRDYAGCDDRTPPRDNRALDLPQGLYFAGESKVWTGGLAFITHEPSSLPAKARAYLITANQFEQIAAQESWRETVTRFDLAAVREAGRMTVGDGTGNYDELVYCGELEGCPIISFTSPRHREDINTPAPAYLRMITAGLRKAHGMSVEDAAAYLIQTPGIAGRYTVQQLVDIQAVSVAG